MSFRSAGIAFLLAAASSAAAQNLVPNGDFDTSTSGWTVSGGAGTVAFSAEDSRGVAGSGSALLTNTDAINGAFVTLSRCVNGFPARSAAASLRWKWGASTMASASDLYIDINGYPNAGCTGDGNSLANVGIGGGTGSTTVWSDLFAFAQTAPVAIASFDVRIEFRKNFAGGSAKVLIDDVFVAASVPRRTVVPASASIHGQNGTFFQTDVWALNHAAMANVFYVEHRCAAGQTCSGNIESIGLAPGTSQRFVNFLQNENGDPGTSGALIFEWDGGFGDLSILTRTYSPSLPAPTTGTGITPLETTEARKRSVLIGLASNGGNLSAGFRTNVGFFNDTSTATTATVTLHDGNGTVLGTTTVTVSAHQPVQINDVFAAVGAPHATADAAWAVVDSGQPLYSYATVIDNQSADSIFVAGVP